MNIVNLTPHELNVRNVNGEMIAIPSSGEARCAVSRECVGEIDGIATFETRYGDVTGLPEQMDDTVFVVSFIVLSRVMAERPDVYAPGELIRNEKGQPIGCIGLSR